MLKQFCARNQQLVALITLAFLFLCMGMLTSLNDLLIPQMKRIFDLNYKQALFVQVVWYSAFVIGSYPLGAFIRHKTYKIGIVSGYLLAALGALLFVAAWWQDAYWAFLVALFVLASGITMLQVIANPFAIALGSPDKAAQRLVIFHAFFAIGTTIAPMLALLLINSSLDVTILSLLPSTLKVSITQENTIQVVIIYSAFLIYAILLAITTTLQSLPDVLAKERKHRSLESQSIKSAWLYPQTTLGAIAAFLCVGAEILVGSFMISFVHSECPQLSVEILPLFVSLFWGGILVGRIVGPLLFKLWDVESILFVNALISSLLTMFAVSAQGIIAAIAMTAVGLFNAVMYPIIYSSAIKSLPPSIATQASSIVSTAVIGGAVIPMMGANVADYYGLNSAFFIASLCYGLIGLYPLYLKFASSKNKILTY